MSTTEKIDLVLTELRTMRQIAGDVLDVNGAAAFLKVSPGVLQQISRPGNNLIKHTKVGKEKRFTKKALLDYLEKYSVKPLNQ